MIAVEFPLPEAQAILLAMGDSHGDWTESHERNLRAGQRRLQTAVKIETESGGEYQGENPLPLPIRAAA